jgi:NADPH-dependent curcumin reductase CurA
MKRVVLASRPKQNASVDNFRIEDAKQPSISGNNQILLKTLFLSADPYMKGRMDGTSEYIEAFEVGKPITGGGVGEVLESTSPKFKQGDLVYSLEYPWQTLALFDEQKQKDLKKVTDLEHPSYALSVLGMPGITAYFGFTDICKPKEGQTVLVTGAAGAVGSMVGQIAKILGCKVVGVAGSEDKLKELKELGFDGAVNYKKGNLVDAIKKACPQGIDCFFDNVGGPVMDATFESLNVGSRVALCGAISQYSGENLTGKRLNWTIIQRGILVKGFVVFREYGSRFDEGMKAMEGWLKQGKLKINETSENGIENAPRALINIFEGKNVGKQIVTLAEAPTSR